MLSVSTLRTPGRMYIASSDEFGGSALMTSPMTRMLCVPAVMMTHAALGSLANPVRKHVRNLRNVDEDLAKRVAAGLAMAFPAASTPASKPFDMKPSDALSIVKQGDPPMTGRKVAILFDEGSGKAEIDALTAAVQKAGGAVFTIAPKVGGLKLRGGTMKADGQLAGSPSVLFDAVAVVLHPDAAEKLTREGAAVQFLMDAFGHVKTIGHNPGAQALLDKAGVVPDAGVVALAEFAKIAPKRHWDREPKVRTLA